MIEIDKKESESDRIERSLIKDIFNTSLDKAEKILIKNIVVHIGDISDLAVDVKDRLTLAIIKGEFKLMYRLLSGVFMGWSLGSNDSANIFGTAVFSKTIRYRDTVILFAIFVIIGALLERQRGMHPLSGLVMQTRNSAFSASLAAALTVTLMTILRLPVSTSQTIIGVVLGIGMLKGVQTIG